MKNLITIEQLNAKRPIKPKYLGWRLLLISFIDTMIICTASAMVSLSLLTDLNPESEGFIMIVQMCAMLFPWFWILIHQVVVRNFGSFFGFLTNWTGVKTYFKEMREFNEVCHEYDKQQEYLRLKKKYENL